MPDRKAAGIAPQVEEPTGSRPELSGSGQGSPFRQASEGPAPLARLKEVETGRFRPNRIRTGLDEGLRFLVQVRRLEGSEFASIFQGSRIGSSGDFGSHAVRRSGTGLAPARAAKGRGSRACPRADDLAAKGRRFAFGRCRERAGCWSVRASAQGPAARKRSLLRAGAAKDRGRGVRFSCDVRQRKDRGSPRAQAANGSRRGVRFHVEDPAAEGSELASVRGCKRVETGSSLLIEGPAGGRIGVRFDLKLAKRVRHDREVRLSIAACPCGKAIGLARIGGLRRHSFPGSSVFPSGRQAARSGRSRPLRTGRGGRRKAPAFRRTLGTATRGASALLEPTSSKRHEAKAAATLRKRGTGIQASALPGLAGNRPGLTAWTGPTGTTRRLRPPSGVRPPSG